MQKRPCGAIVVLDGPLGLMDLVGLRDGERSTAGRGRHRGLIVAAGWFRVFPGKARARIKRKKSSRRGRGFAQVQKSRDVAEVDCAP